MDICFSSSGLNSVNTDPDHLRVGYKNKDNFHKYIYWLITTLTVSITMLNSSTKQSIITHLSSITTIELTCSLLRKFPAMSMATLNLSSYDLHGQLRNSGKCPLGQPRTVKLDGSQVGWRVPELVGGSSSRMEGPPVEWRVPRSG